MEYTIEPINKNTVVIKYKLKYGLFKEGRLLSPSNLSSINEKLNYLSLTENDKERIEKYTNNPNILKLNLRDIPDYNIQACIETFENLYSKYNSNDRTLFLTETFIRYVFLENKPPLKDDITLDEIYDYFKNICDLSDIEYICQKALEVFKKQD